ncbi:MAG: threonylcarbamoyl-AMP synthase [Bacteroidetes bacterium 4572_128]|nr:MAG: threonylcarbamoyl-AMP synthase [Bacteroidetes bacterium 4572_128]
MYIKIYPDNPNQKAIKKVIDVLKRGGIIIYPTDSVYGFGCDIYASRAVEKIARIKNIKKKDIDFSLVCSDLSHLSDFTQHVGNRTFKMMKKNLPGAFTFILNANNKVPKLFKRKKKTVGIRVPDNNIAREIVNFLGNPIMSTSVRSDDKIIDYMTDPELIHERYKDIVDLVIDGGYGNNDASTIVNCVYEEFEIIRQGKSNLL